jgi:hypothetical protein
MARLWIDVSTISRSWEYAENWAGDTNLFHSIRRSVAETPDGPSPFREGAKQGAEHRQPEQRQKWPKHPNTDASTRHRLFRLLFRISEECPFLQVHGRIAITLVTPQSRATLLCST